MAKLLSLFLVYSLATSSCLLLNNIIFITNGLKIEMIHPNSQESSLLQADPSSYEERIRRLVSLSTRRKTSSSYIPRPLIDLQEFNYIVKIGIGTFRSKPPFKEYYLDMDTGSSFTWMQCEGCTTCFKQKPAPFPKNRSSSFQLVRDGANNPSTYKLGYKDGSKTSGIVAKETLHLNSNNGSGSGSSSSSVAGFVFGCGLVNNAEYGEYKNNRIAGVMGLGWGDFSFVTQIRESKGRFSYCLPVVNMFTKARPKTYLRLGDDIVQGRQKSSSTTLKKVDGVGSYYLGLQGISINTKRLNISSNAFAFEGRKGGCIIDSGTPYSRIIQPAYLKLKQGLEDHFSNHNNLKKVTAVSLGLDLCYERLKPEGFKNLPEITFHFEGGKGDMIIRPEGGFEVFKKSIKFFKFQEYFCLAMLPSRVKTIIGAHQQTNQRIVYDTLERKLMFRHQDCSQQS
ncbi:hypothetical protein C2S52_003930 [Perilla frutescens var. hirtella]|nr:hypothetical protein C2S52_003930 [Perilla frutescens var. hirtella]